MIVIDGVVGCGKTTMGKILESELGIKLYEELTNDDTFKLLDKFYADQRRWSFTLQIHFLNERFRMIKDIHRNNGGLLDRSIFGDRIFAEMLNEDGAMSNEEFKTYDTLLNNMLEHAQPPTLLVYLQCDVDTAIERINIRNRGLESEVPKTYWQRLNEKYEEWYKNYTHSPKLCIDVNKLDINDPEQVKKVITTIKEAAQCTNTTHM